VIGFGLNIPAVAVRRSGPSVPLFNPTTLFLGDTGGWYDATDRAALFQDSAGTTPVTAAGQPVGKMLDKSGNGNHLTVATAGFRPLYQSGGGLLFDGVDDFLTAAFTLNQPTTRIMAAKQITFAGRYLLDGGGAANNAILGQQATPPQIAMYSGLVGPLTSDMTLGVNHVVTEQINTVSSKLAIDNGVYATGSTGAALPAGLTIASSGAQGAGSFCNMLFFGIICIGRILSDPDIAKCRTRFGAMAGLSL
jgi:hypothetical protein